MATRHASAVKAHRQTLKRTEHNRELRSKLRTGLKAVRAAIDAGDTAGAKESLSQTFSLIDKMAGKGIIHDNAAGRYKSRLAKASERREVARQRRPPQRATRARFPRHLHDQTARAARARRRLSS